MCSLRGGVMEPGIKVEDGLQIEAGEAKIQRMEPLGPSFRGATQSRTRNSEVLTRDSGSRASRNDGERARISPPRLSPRPAGPAPAIAAYRRRSAPRRRRAAFRRAP